MAERRGVGYKELADELERLFSTPREIGVEWAGSVVYGQPGQERLVVASIGCEPTPSGRMAWMSVAEQVSNQHELQRFFFLDILNLQLQTAVLDEGFPPEVSIMDGHKFLSETGQLHDADPTQWVAFRRALQTFYED